MQMRPTELELSCRFLDNGYKLLPAKFRWVSDRPLEVALIFQPPGALPVDWMIGRDLLLEGMESVVGVGDVRMTPAPARDILHLTLSSPNGHGMFRCSLAAVRTFLDRTMQFCPLNAEQAAIDEALDDFLITARPATRQSDEEDE